MSSHVQAIFDAAAPDYDRLRRQLVPDFEHFYGTVLDLVPYAPLDTFRVLDAGAGTGLLTSLLAERFPRATFTLADISTEMLNQARERFVGRENVSYMSLDFVNDHIGGTYDLAVSALALHHTPQPQLVSVFESIYGVLRTGGMFINADQTLGMTPENEHRYESRWQADAREQGCTDEEVAQAMERMKADRTATLEDQLRWMREAGFGAVECWYKQYRFAVYSGLKSSSPSS